MSSACLHRVNSRAIFSEAYELDVQGHKRAFVAFLSGDLRGRVLDSLSHAAFLPCLGASDVEEEDGEEEGVGVNERRAGGDDDDDVPEEAHFVIGGK